MSQFSVKGDKNSKLKFAFRIYDIDNDGYISNGELFQVSPLSTTCYQFRMGSHKPLICSYRLIVSSRT